MESGNADLIAEFAIESLEGLANIEQQMLAIEAGGSDVDLELVNGVFRTMHSIKGTSGFLGFERIGALAHRLEEVLNHMRNREIVPSSELVTTVLEAADFMKQLLDAVESSNEADISVYAEKLEKFRPGKPETVSPANVLPAAADRADVSAEKEPPTPSTLAPTPLCEAVREFLIECYENLDLMDRDLLALEKGPGALNLLRGIFRTIHTIKGGAGFLGLGLLEIFAHTAENLLGKLRDGALPLTDEVVGALLMTVDKCREGLRLLEHQGNDAGFEFGAAVEQLLAAERSASAQPSAESVIDTGVSAGPAIQPKTTAASACAKLSVTIAAPVASPPAQEIDKTSTKPAVVANEGAAADRNLVSAGDSTIRVDVALLDKLMTRVGELVLARNQILQHTNRLDDAEFISTAQRLNLITTELQEGVMKTRMQPIGNVWAKFPRVVRDLASQLGKQVRIEMEGKETELDKTIVEAIKDPLTHLVRNSVDHGIETPETRLASGKPAEGCLFLRAYHEGGQVNIEITDDGAGLNLDRIRKKAVERGLLSADQAARLSDRDASQMIFAPGFSTAERVTSVSGRGVGMDVVKTNIERISGTIDLQSRPGQGTTIRIKIPLTLAIIPALVVTNGGDRYAIPQVSLLELLRLDGAEAKRGIEYVHGAPVYRLRGKLLPLVYLSERLGLVHPIDGGSQAADDRVINIVVLRANDRQFGLVVDKVNDTEEIVVKPLSRQLNGLSEYAGATIMGDGTVALILDVMGLAVAAGLAAENREQNVASALQSDGQSTRPLETLLIVDLGDARRFALPTSMISRLEMVAQSAIEYADGREVIQYRGAIMPLVRLNEVFGVLQSQDNARQEIQIVVYAEQNHRCGLVVNHIVDIVETDLQLSSADRAEENLLGTAVIQERVTDVLNLPRLARRPVQPKFIAHEKTS